MASQLQIKKKKKKAFVTNLEIEKHDAPFPTGVLVCTCAPVFLRNLIIISADLIHWDRTVKGSQQPRRQSARCRSWPMIIQQSLLHYPFYPQALGWLSAGRLLLHEIPWNLDKGINNFFSFSLTLQDGFFSPTFSLNAIFRWLVSTSEYDRGLLGLGRGMRSTDCSTNYMSIQYSWVGPRPSSNSAFVLISAAHL